MCGVNLTRIDGIDVTTVLKVLAEVGADFSKFNDAEHFASWLGLCPGTKISGGKVITKKNTANGSLKTWPNVPGHLAFNLFRGLALESLDQWLLLWQRNQHAYSRVEGYHPVYPT